MQRAKETLLRVGTGEESPDAYSCKVMGKVIIKRISRGVDKKLRKEQAVFRSGRSTIEQILVLRNIIEQSVRCSARGRNVRISLPACH